MPPDTRDAVFHAVVEEGNYRTAWNVRDAVITVGTPVRRGDSLASLYYYVQELLGNDFEFADEEYPVVSNPISYDELMGGDFGAI